MHAARTMVDAVMHVCRHLVAEHACVLKDGN